MLLLCYSSQESIFSSTFLEKVPKIAAQKVDLKFLLRLTGESLPPPARAGPPPVALRKNFLTVFVSKRGISYGKGYFKNAGLR